jgi:hypothetical protein
MTRKKILVAPAAEFSARRRLFGLLGELYPVDFSAWSPGSPAECDGVIIWGDAEKEFPTLVHEAEACLVVAPSSGRNVSVEKGAVKFSEMDLIDSAFRGQTLVDECIGSFPALQLCDNDKVICTVNSEPYWILRAIGATSASIIAMGPAEPGERETVYDLFNRRRWLQLLPFFHFLKQLTRDNDWEAPPLRACLMFDDPNLHWPTYGYIDLRKLVQHARDFNYHVCSAMVPFDGWFASSGVAALFKEHKERISLCMHGNDHAYLELGAPLDAERFGRLLAQGLRRIEAFEKRSGIAVARVMVPPYGAFRETVANPMLKLGYEAVCVSRASLTAWNKDKNWSPSFGHPVTEFIDEGLPVIPRHVMAPGHEIAYRLAAFLNQPIIPHGHHQDCANGLDLLSDVSGSINRIGKIIWSDMTTLSRSNYLLRRSNDTVVVKMLARRISLALPEGTRQIVIERPWIGSDAGRETLTCTANGQTIFSAESARQSQPIPVSGARSVECMAPPPDALDYRRVESPPFQAWITARRILTEARDRIAPLRMSRKETAHTNGTVRNGK